MAKSFSALIGISPPSTLTRYTTSWLLPPFALAILRLLISFYAFIALFVILGTDTAKGRQQHLSYFTNLTYWGVAFYFLFSGLHTLSYARNGVSWLQHWPRPLQAAHAIFHTTIITYPFLVTIVFWAVIYAGPWFSVRLEAWSNISEHALNSFFALLEIILPSTPTPPLLHLPFIVILLALYLGLAYLTHKTQGFYPYGFLNPANGKGKTAGYIIGVAVAACVIFGVVWVLVWVRRKLTGGREKRARGDEAGVVGMGGVEGEKGVEYGVGGGEVGIDAEMGAYRR